MKTQTLKSNKIEISENTLAWSVLFVVCLGFSSIFFTALVIITEISLTIFSFFTFVILMALLPLLLFNFIVNTFRIVKDKK